MNQDTSLRVCVDLLRSETFVLTEEDAYWVVDLAGDVMLRVRSFEEHATVFEITKRVIPAQLEEIETSVIYDGEIVQLSGPGTLSIAGEQCSA